MTRYALIAALTALCGALGWLWVQSGTMGRLQAENASLSRSQAVLIMTAEHNATARDVARAATERQVRIAAKAQGDVETILTGEFGGCIDAKLPDDLRAILDRVRAED